MTLHLLFHIIALVLSGGCFCISYLLIMAGQGTDLATSISTKIGTFEGAGAVAFAFFGMVIAVATIWNYKVKFQ